MKSIPMLLVPLLLAGCGEGPDEEILEAPLRIVETPEYPSVPLPDGLVWETNVDDPTFASPNALRGGTLHVWMQSFPLTLRLVGPDSNGAFAGFLRPNHLGLVDFHPNTLRPTPSLATHWAFDPDGRTVYYKLNPSARWSDGTPVTADDFVFTRDFMRSEHIVAPWYNNQFTNYVI
ncbi:MAG: ABC transporter substrate-binding protein, partial [Gammaproteobacteria bacterium]